MAHTSTTYTHSTTGIKLYIIKADAADVELVSLVDQYNRNGKFLQDTRYYGMNASWFGYYKDEDDGYTYAGIENIAYQDGVNLGAAGTGHYSNVGDCMVYFKNNAINYAEGITLSSDSRIPKTSGTWAQTGLGLNLGSTNWLQMFKAQPHVEDYSTGSAKRTAMVIDKANNKIYLIATTDSVTVSNFRSAIMSYLGLVDQTLYSNWKAILLDGGRSTQIFGRTFNVQPTLSRAVPQIISVGTY